MPIVLPEVAAHLKAQRKNPQVKAIDLARFVEGAMLVSDTYLIVSATPSDVAKLFDSRKAWPLLPMKESDAVTYPHGKAPEKLGMKPRDEEDQKAARRLFDIWNEYVIDSDLDELKVHPWIFATETGAHLHILTYPNGVRTYLAADLVGLFALDFRTLFFYGLEPGKSVVIRDDQDRTLGLVNPWNPEELGELPFPFDPEELKPAA